MSKRIREWPQFIDRNAMYKMADAFEALQRIPAPRFIESVDTAIRLGVDPRKSDQVVRGSVVLPNSHGKTVRVAVFADGDAAMQAKQAGADVVGMEDLVETIKGGDLQFNVVIATPAAMPTVGRLGQILGPRGLMPNPKVGTVTQDVATAVKNAKSGQVRYRTDKNGIIHCTIGRADFSVSALCENLQALITALQKAKPVNAKGVYLKKIAVSTTMGPGLTVDVASVSA